MRAFVLFVFLVLFCVSSAGAFCKEECEQDYKTATESCNIEYNDPDDADLLQECLDQAKNDYDSCLEECMDEWDEEAETERTLR